MPYYKQLLRKVDFISNYFNINKIELSGATSEFTYSLFNFYKLLLKHPV